MSNLFVQIIPPANFKEPIIGRNYTLTHSDETGELFLTIGYVYNGLAINWMLRDEVLAEWKWAPETGFYLLGVAYVDQGEFNEEQAARRYKIFNREMDTALRGIIQGDSPFLQNYPFLLRAPIYIQFQSAYPQFHHTKFFGTVAQYV
ncbi:staygreen family protein [Fervidibacillus halotolerans]|uniref:Staygreen family protein n=1 Tax=Fervidibacillus halotolerans TaxID=2980027 RepID=A0A9E8RYP2_9BACI|nr:staygreen family protein [Fervidibacillus halotolerans]WAA12468.1 staygreen family protein [Fervidibacillus halotolerans]